MRIIEHDTEINSKPYELGRMSSKNYIFKIAFMNFHSIDGTKKFEIWGKRE